MHFIFGYQREIQVKAKRNTSKIALVVLAILIISLLIFLSFENLDGFTMSAKGARPAFGGNGIQSWIGGGLVKEFKIQSSRFKI